MITPTFALDKEYRVIGVVGGVRYFGFEKDPGPEIYFPIRQTGDFRNLQRHFLFGSANDWTTFAGVLAVLTCVAALAGYVPARCASRLNPLDTLRGD